jgi:hypothetical protein
VARFRRFIERQDAVPFRGYRFHVGSQYALRWRDYEVTGTLELHAGRSGFDLAVYSQAPMGYRRGYFVNLEPEEGRVRLSSAAAEGFTGLTSAALPEMTSGLSFKVQAQTLADRTVVRFKAWPSGSHEPDDWSLEGVDESAQRARSGSVGLRFNPEDAVGRIRVVQLDHDPRRPAVGEGREGVVEMPVNEPIQCISSNDQWMSLEELQVFVGDARTRGKPAMLASKLDRLLRARVQPGYTILMSHRPRVVEVIGGKHIDLVVAGHTQGGQINVPLMGRFLFDTYQGTVLDRGLKQIGESKLYINRGIGTSFVPLRFGSQPEVTAYEFGE